MNKKQNNKHQFFPHLLNKSCMFAFAEQLPVMMSCQEMNNRIYLTES